MQKARCHPDKSGLQPLVSTWFPVTYLITPQVAEASKHLLTTFHKEYKDCVGLMLDFPDVVDTAGRRIRESKEIIGEMTVPELRSHIAKEIAAIKVHLPWAEIRVLGGGYRTDNVVQAA